MSGRTILITGASSGIGAAFARSYAARGHNLVLVARRIERLEALKAELYRDYGITCTCLSADLSQPDAVEALINAINTQGLKIDGLINNAGYSVARTYERTIWQQQSDFIAVCVTTPSRLAHAFLPHMRAQKFGRIINVSSIAAFSQGAAGHTLYPAAKSYMLKFSRSLAAEVAKDGIYVTAVCPGATESEFHQANGMDEIMKKSPLPGMSAEAVVETAIKANEQGREVIVPGLINKIAVVAMTLLPDVLITPLIRAGAKKYQLKD